MRKKGLTVFLITLLLIFLPVQTTVVDAFGQSKGTVSAQKRKANKKTGKKYKITFNANGGKVGKKSKTVCKGVKYGMLPKPTKKGYTFAGWYTAKKGGKKILPNVKVSKNKKHTLYARWKIVTYKITYQLDGGVNSEKNPAAVKVTTPTVKLSNPTKQGYIFQGWYSEKNYKTKVTSLVKGSVGNRTLYAKWELSADDKITYKITYYLGSGTNHAGNPSGYNSQTEDIILKEPSRPGYRFKGWFTGSDYKTNVKIIKKGSVGNKTLYAKWEPIVYKIHYHLNDGTNHESNPDSYTMNTPDIMLRKPTLTDFIFQGWYSDSNFTTQVNSIKKGSKGDKELYAKWEPRPVFMVSKIILSPSEVKLFPNETQKLTADVRPENAEDKTVEFFSDDDNIAVVDRDTGMIHAKEAGKATITARSVDGGNVTSSVEVTVEPVIIKADKLVMNKKELNLHIGETEQLTACIYPEDTTDKTITWSSNASRVAKVDEEGLMTAVGYGQAKIRAACADGLFAECNVTVSPRTIYINTPQDLMAVKDDLSAHYILNRDIDLTGYSWTPIGAKPEVPFTGIIDGNGHRITGLNLTDSSRKYAGLVGCNEGTIQNLTVSGKIDLDLTKNNIRQVWVGGICGESERGTITGCCNQAEIRVVNSNTQQGAYAYAGGICGLSGSHTEISNCTNTGNITVRTEEGTRADAYAGGIVGWNNASSIDSCTNTGNIHAYAATSFTKYLASAYAGGIAGETGGGAVSNCENTGNIKSESYPIGKTEFPSWSYAGGIVGYESSTKEESAVGGKHSNGEIVALGNEFCDEVREGDIVGSR